MRQSPSDNGAPKGDRKPDMMLRPSYPSQSSGFRFPFELCIPALGRAAIAMAAVRSSARVEPGKFTDHSKIHPPTDVMAITSLPDPTRAARGAAPTPRHADAMSSHPYLLTAISLSTRSATRSAPPASPSPSTEAFHFFQRAQSPVKASAMIARAEAAVSP